MIKMFLVLSSFIGRSSLVASQSCLGFNEACENDSDCCGHPQNNAVLHNPQKKVVCVMLNAGNPKRCFEAWGLGSTCQHDAQCLSQKCHGGACVRSQGPSVPSQDLHVPIRRLNKEVKQQSFNFSSDLKGCNSASIPSDTFIPIFVMSRDRLTALKKSVESYQQTFDSPYEIIILDHFSTYPPMLEYYKKMQDEKQFTVHSLKSASWNDALSESSRFIDQYLEDHPKAGYYVFTDSDVAFYNTKSDVLLFFAANLAACPEVKIIGPALKISNIPDSYEFNPKYLRNHKRFYADVPNVATWKDIGYHVVTQPIDTTFAMRRRETKFSRMIHKGNTLRAYAPYIATHTDWYDDSKNLPEDKIWYKAHLGQNEKISHHLKMF